MATIVSFPLINNSGRVQLLTALSSSHHHPQDDIEPNGLNVKFCLFFPAHYKHSETL